MGVRECTRPTRVQGIAWGQYETGYTHELAHWLGVDLNGDNRASPALDPRRFRRASFPDSQFESLMAGLPEYHYSDGAHLNGHCTIHGPLQGPVWCWDTGYPCAVRYNDGDAILEPNHDSSGVFDGTFRYVAYTTGEGKGDLLLFQDEERGDGDW